MSLAYPHERLQLPDGLQRQLLDFRRRVWTDQDGRRPPAPRRFAVVAAYLLMFLLDRVFDTPAWLRATLFVAGVRRLPARSRWPIYRWIWRNRRLEQLAMLLSRKHPAVGDQLLGIIELVRNDFEQARSRALCEAAVREVAKDAQSRDFSDAVPRPAAQVWACAAAVPIVAAIALGLAFPAAARSAWARLLVALGRHAALHLRRARAAALAAGRRARRAVLGHGEAGRARPSGTRPGPRPSSTARPRSPPHLQDGRYEFEPARRRSIPAG